MRCVANVPGRLTAVGRVRAPRRLRALLIPVFLSAGCSGPLSALDPAGPGAARIERLWWILFWIATIVFAAVVGLILYSLRHGRRDLTPDIDKDEAQWGDRFIAVVGVVIPVLILLGGFIYSLGEMNALATHDDEGPALDIEVVSHNWWWEVRYPNGAVTANEIHIPTGERIRLTLTTADVIHSFWVPRLQAKMDHVPGSENQMWIEADEPGIYRGQCAEFCGLQHAHMAFFVEAESPEDFDRWYENAASSASTPSDGSARRGLDVFLSSSCVGCHAIEGTEAAATAGPDLTHLAARETLFAGKLVNTRANLERLIVDPQGIKPGVGMPPTELDSGELEALLDYLESLD
ncbi:MAG: cytochrome c oxidase subunit II [Actinobacteria bacterium]|nr:cytochrome c oxidase subunit II [Actinomycetota bacterium]